ncbi:hypothetical protein Mapa_016086 [Marchantia paleacea]|nr:hypothetical protein Mapa_016086 [Marchantia paleacea]
MISTEIISVRCSYGRSSSVVPSVRFLQVNPVTRFDSVSHSWIVQVRRVGITQMCLTTTEEPTL